MMLRAATVLCAVLLLLFGSLMAKSGFRTLGQWHRISGLLVAIGVLWIVLGILMLAAGTAAVLYKGKGRLPLWAGSAGAALAGFTIIAGVLTYVIPCAGPS